MYGHTHLDYSLYDNVWDLWNEKDGEELRQEVARARVFIGQLFAEIHDLEVQITLLKGNRLHLSNLIGAAIKKYKADGNIEDFIEELRFLERTA